MSESQRFGDFLLYDPGHKLACHLLDDRYQQEITDVGVVICGPGLEIKRLSGRRLDHRFHGPLLFRVFKDGRPGVFILIP